MLKAMKNQLQGYALIPNRFATEALIQAQRELVSSLTMPHTRGRMLWLAKIPRIPSTSEAWASFWRWLSTRHPESVDFLFLRLILRLPVVNYRSKPARSNPHLL